MFFSKFNMFLDIFSGFRYYFIIKELSIIIQNALLLSDESLNSENQLILAYFLIYFVNSN